MLIGVLALGPVFQRHKGQPGVLPLAGEAETQHANHALHLGLLEHEAFDLFHHRLGALNRGAGWQLHVHQQRALVFSRQKRRGQAGIDQCHHANDGGINDHVTPGPLEQTRHHAFITLGSACKTPVEPAEQSGLGVVVPGFYRLEQRGAQRWRQRQGQESRKRNRRDHDGRELAVNIAHRAGKKGQRHKH